MSTEFGNEVFDVAFNVMNKNIQLIYDDDLDSPQLLNLLGELTNANGGLLFNEKEAM